MKIAINQPYFFPYIGFFQLIESVDKFILYDRVKFQRRSWMTRNRLIDFSSGNPYNFFIPVRASQMISDVEILTDDYKVWANRFLKKLHHNYRRAAFFDETYSLLEFILKSIDTDRLHVFNSKVIKHLCSHLAIKTKIQYKNDRYISIEQELNEIYKDCTDQMKMERKRARIFQICKMEGADTYINLPGGTSLYQQQHFSKEGLKLSFLQLPHLEYEQFNFEFTPYLSIIDLLMHLGKDKTKDFISSFQLTGGYATLA